MCFLIGVGQMLVWWLVHRRFVRVPWIVAKPPRCKHTLTNQLHMISISNILRLFQFQSSPLKAFYGVKSRPLLSSGLKPLIFICTLHQNPGGHQRPWCQCLQRSMVPPWGALALATWPIIFWFHEFFWSSCSFVATLCFSWQRCTILKVHSLFHKQTPSSYLWCLHCFSLHWRCGRFITMSVLLVTRANSKVPVQQGRWLQQICSLQHWAWNLRLQVRN